MDRRRWVQEFSGAVTVCDPEGIILEMNDQAASTFQERGGMQLVGSNLLDCHPEPARARLRQLLEQQQMNVYTVEKSGVKKLIYQAPWYTNGQYSGFVEISLVLPASMPHFVRDGAPERLPE